MNKKDLIKYGMFIFMFFLMITAFFMFFPKKKTVLTKEEYEAKILKAATTYAHKNKDMLNEDIAIDKYAFFKIEDLVNYNYLDRKIINPLTNKQIDLNQYIKVTHKEDGEYSFEIGADYLKPTSFYKYLNNTVSKNQYTMYTDMTIDNNIRFSGNTPNNYLYLKVDDKDELFRIIGLFKNIDNGNGKLENRVKVIKENSLGVFAIDAKNSNNWNNTTISKYLNGEYLNKFKNINNENAKALYNLGGNKNSSLYTNNMYESERYAGYEDNRYYVKGNNQTFTGVIGLMYLSDYGYASGLLCAGTTNKKGYQTLSGYSDTCYSKNWLYKNTKEWTITPVTNDNHTIFMIKENGSTIDNQTAENLASIRPVLYLPITTAYQSGDGSISNPYRIEVK